MLLSLFADRSRLSLTLAALVQFLARGFFIDCILSEGYLSWSVSHLSSHLFPANHDHLF